MKSAMKTIFRKVLPRKILPWRILPCLALAGCAGLALPALAQQATPDTQNGRYAMTPAPNGFLRMDTRSGAVSLCTLRDGNVACASSADERGALETEISRLSKENADLRERLAKLTQNGAAPRASGRESRGGLPSEDEMNRAMGFAETFMRRMMRIVREEAPENNRL